MTRRARPGRASYGGGGEKATIDECLCHVGELRMADIYIESDWSLLDAANRRVIDSLRWPDK